MSLRRPVIFGRVKRERLLQALPHRADGDKLVIATDEAIAEVAHSAMPLSQGHERAAQILGEILPEEDAHGLSD